MQIDYVQGKTAQEHPLTRLTKFKIPYSHGSRTPVGRFNPLVNAPAIGSSGKKSDSGIGARRLSAARR